MRKDEEEARLKEEREEGRMMLAVSARHPPWAMALPDLDCSVPQQDSEARLDLLRERASVSKSSSSSRKRRERLEDEGNMKRIADGTPGLIESSSSSAAEVVSTLVTPAGHINLFVSLEATLSNAQMQSLEKKANDAAIKKQEERGDALAPSVHDMNPWYADRMLKGGKERDLEKDVIAKDRKQYVSFSS